MQGKTLFGMDFHFVAFVINDKKVFATMVELFEGCLRHVVA